MVIFEALLLFSYLYPLRIANCALLMLFFDNATSKGGGSYFLLTPLKICDILEYF